MTKRTFCMIKPDAVKAGKIFQILKHITDSGMKIVKIEKKLLTVETVTKLYDEHKEKSFFGEIRDFITSDEVVILVLEHDDAVAHLRNHMGATKSADAHPDTIRGKWGNKDSIMENCIHGSDSFDSAAREIDIMFL